MYIKKLIYKNIGPILSNNIEFSFSEDGKPIPVVLVGANGAGKSVFLSNITDAFYELAGTAFNDVLEYDKGGGHRYYKTISPEHIKIGHSWMGAYMEFEHNSNILKYVFKSGNVSFSDFASREGIVFDKKIDWKDNVNYKNTVGDKAVIEKVFGESVVAYFSPMRYEKPSWLGDKYYSYQGEPSFSHDRQYNGHLYNSISVNCDSEITLKWLFDIIADSRADLEKNGKDGYTIVYPPANDIDLLSISRNNAEKLLSAIIGKQVIFRMGNRSNAGRRLSICDLHGNTLVPSLDSLSTGQLALFNLFSSIIRYADNEDINLSYRLDEISGIVLIDEIELHLHSILQREVLPRLISLFPKIQFIITSHSPLFLLGMKDCFGEDKIDVYEMPTANKINVEDFDEFEKAYSYYSDTQKHRKEIKEIIDSTNQVDRPIVITEGSTDWKHMKAAFDALQKDERFKELLAQIDFDFLEYEPENSSREGIIKLQMSCSEMVSMCKSYSKISNSRKMIFIADNDDPRTKMELGGSPYKVWGNNVYSFCLPSPQHRMGSDVCIEHYYSDEELKREVIQGNATRRFFLGNEFDETGHCEIDGAFYYCSAMQNQKSRERNTIIDGSDSKKVFRIGDKERVNYALPKTQFADYVLEKKAPFNVMDFEPFMSIFEVLGDILKETI